MWPSLGRRQQHTVDSRDKVKNVGTLLPLIFLRGGGGKCQQIIDGARIGIVGDRTSK